MISHLPLVVPVTWAVISLSAGEAGRGRYPCQRLARVPTTAGFRGAFPASMSPAHKPHARVKQLMVRLHFTWTKCLREGLTHHTPENMNFREPWTPGVIADYHRDPPTLAKQVTLLQGFSRGRGEAWVRAPGLQAGPWCQQRDLSIQFSPVGISTKVIRREVICFPASHPSGCSAIMHLLPTGGERAHRPSRAGTASTARLSRDPGRPGTRGHSGRLTYSQTHG